jgi:hypothetical protein
MSRHYEEINTVIIEEPSMPTKRPAPPPPEEFEEHNPLAKYFRTPALHVPLPTNGAFMPPGGIEFDMKGMVPVYPMRAADELLLKSPDALMSGYAIERLLESCVPAIKAPRLISSPDLDVLLLAVRAATYGEVIDTTSTCPQCGAENVVRSGLGHLVATMKPVPPENVVRLSDEMVAYMRPYNLANATRIGITSFEEMRKVQGMENADPDQRRRQINESMQLISLLTTEMLADCVVKIVIPDGPVTDRAMIREFIDNVSKEWTDWLQKKLDELNALGIEKKYEVTCEKCGHCWESQIEFDPATFFEAAS